MSQSSGSVCGSVNGQKYTAHTYWYWQGRTRTTCLNHLHHLHQHFHLHHLHQHFHLHQHYHHHHPDSRRCKGWQLCICYTRHWDGNETNWYLINKSHTPSQAKHLASPIWYVTQASSQTFLASLMILTHTFCILRLVGTLAVPKLHFLIFHVSPCWNRDSLIFILLLF